MLEYILQKSLVVIDRSRLVEYVPKLFGSIVVVVVCIIVYKLTSIPIRKILLRSRVQEVFANLLIDSLYKTIVVLVAIIGILDQFGVNILAALTGVGVVGIAIGFAAQDSLSNIISGFLIFLDKPFLVGDYITVGDNYGKVELITMRSTRIRTQDNKYIVIPNQKIINEVLVDHSTNGETRLIIKVAISYSESIEHARSVILAEVDRLEDILKNPEPDVVVARLADSGVELYVRVWIKNAQREMELFFKTSEAVRNSLMNANIEIPYPHMRVLMGEPKNKI